LLVKGGDLEAAAKSLIQVGNTVKGLA
jgi:hypothetical protein